MPKIPKHKYTAEFKTRAVQHVKEVQSISIVAKELGVAEQTLRNWVQVDQKRLLDAPQLSSMRPSSPNAPDAPPQSAFPPPQIEIARLQSENAYLRAENAALQKGAHDVQGIPVKLGDTVEEVQQALVTSLMPEPTTSTHPMASKRTELRLKTKGIWVFFEKGKIYTFRVDPPFSGSVRGIKLGDSYSKILEIFGPAVKQEVVGASTAFTYYFDDITTTRFIVNRGDEVETIFFHK